MISPFIIKDSSKGLVNIYPDPKQIKDVFTLANSGERNGIVRLWVTEGIPFAFKENPLLYEELRSYIAYWLEVNAKEVTLVGSARMGYSFKPNAWGRSFSSKSDLDFTIISNKLFSKLVDDYQQWVGDFESRKMIPNSALQAKYWLESIETVDSNIPKGYIYNKNLFSNPKYPTVHQLYKTIYLIKQKLDVTQNSPKVKDISIRIYSNWDNCIRQIQINLQSSLKMMTKS